MNDEVTGLASQLGLFDRLEGELERGRRYGRPLSVLMLDVDGLEEINQSTHRLFGSYVLRALGELLHQTLRRSDAVFHFESDEFFVILPETRAQQAIVAAERTRRIIEEHEFISDPFRVQLTVSTGVGGAAGTIGETARDLVRSVDQALDAAKREGRNRCALAS